MSNLREGFIFAGSDHGGFILKNAIVAHLAAQGVQVEDLGVYSEETCDYPRIAQSVCRALLARHGHGILICGTGLGMSIAANRRRGIRAALCTQEAHARLARAHNNANVLCLGQRITARELALSLVDIFLDTDYEGGRHDRRLAMIEKDPE
jgi:ribose 5-phosphate isomerase B